VLSDASNPEFVVALRGEGIAAAVPAEPAPAGMPAPPVEAEPDTEPAPPLVDVCVLERLEGDHLRVAGSVRPVAGVRLRAQVDGGGAAEVLPAADGSFVVEVTGTSAARVTLLAVGSRGLVSAPVEVGQVLPAIAQTGDQLEVRGPAGAEFALLAVVVGDDGRRVLHVLSQWRGSIGPDGKRTLDTAAFRGGATPVTLVAVLQVDGVRRRSNLLQLQK